MPTETDPLRTQLVWNRLLAIVEEQAQTLMRTAFSTVVREAGDLSAGVFDTSGAMLAQAVTGTPGHVNAMAASVGKFLKKIPLQSLAPGDVLLTNDPWDATGHLNDFTVVTPVFRGPEPIALFASTSHIADVGGRGFGPDAEQVFEEGLNIPIGFLFRGGERNATLFSILAANVRDPVVAEGDLYSLAACNESGGRRLLETLDDFGLDGIDAIGAAIIETSKAAMRKEIAALPDGRHEYAMRVDGYDHPIDLRALLVIEGEGLSVDFAGSSPASRFGINVPLPYTQAYATFGVRCLVGNAIPNNAGSLCTVRVSARPGSILNALPPSAVSARHAIGQMLPDVVLGCLEQVLPGSARGRRVLHLESGIPRRGCGGQLCGRGLCDQPHIQRRHRRPTRQGRPFHHRLSQRGAHNADRDQRSDFAAGVLAAGIPTGFGWHRPQSGRLGPDRRDRPSTGRALLRLQDVRPNPVSGAGVATGGGDGDPGRVYLKDGPDLPGKGKDMVPAGANLVLETPGGGGMGSPRERDAKAIAADAEAGLISRRTRLGNRQ